MKMHRSEALGIIAVGVCCWALGHLSPVKVSVAKDEFEGIPADLKPCDVAIVDMGKIFKTDAKFKDQLELVRTDNNNRRDAVRRRQGEHDLREMLVYHECHERIMRLIERHCEKHSIRVVTKNFREPIDLSDGGSIIRNIHRPVIYEKNIDITDAIIEALQADN